MPESVLNTHLCQNYSIKKCKHGLNQKPVTNPNYGTTNAKKKTCNFLFNVDNFMLTKRKYFKAEIQIIN